MRAPLARLALLALLAACGGEAEPARGQGDAAQAVVTQDRFVVRKSVRDFDATLSALLEAVDRRDLTVFAVIDHAAAARGAGADLPPTTVVIFGNPDAGTACIKGVPVMGAELPLRALVYERDGEVFVAATGIANLSRTYALTDQAAILDRAEQALSDILNEVAAP